MAVKFGYEKNRVVCFRLLVLTILGATFVGMQAFEWSKLIFDEGIRPGVIHLAPAVWSCLFHGDGLSWYSRIDGVIFLIITAVRLNGSL